MIIIDTSIWIDFLKGNFQYTQIIIELIQKRDVLLLECITSELLQGAKSKREIQIILNYWDHLPNISSDGLWIEAGILSHKEKLLSKGIGLIDSFIISACKSTRSKLWTLDKKIINNLDKNFLFQP